MVQLIKISSKAVFIMVQTVLLHCWCLVLNATSNNISVILWRSVLLVDKTGLPGSENYRPLASY